MTNILGRFFVIAVLIGGTSIIGAAEDYPGLTGHRFQVRTALDTYRAVDDSNQFKLFAVGTQGAYAWWNGQSYEELYKWVMNSCGGCPIKVAASYTRSATPLCGRCRRRKGTKSLPATVPTNPTRVKIHTRWYKWSVKDNRYCERDDQHTTCYRIAVEGATVYWINDGGKRWEATVVAE